MKKVHNPPNPFHSAHRELLEPAPDAKLTVYEDASRSIVSENDSPDVGFRWSVNAYRGCFHLKRAADNGARYAFHSMVRLVGSVQSIFEEKIKAALPPERVERILHRIQETRGGKMNDTRFGTRMRGEGVYWKSISDLFRMHQKKYKLNRYPQEPDPSPFRVPTPQLELFDSQ